MPHTRPMVLLLAEDDDALRALLLRALRREGYTVIEASDGQQLLDLASAAASRPDLVVSDVQMPRLSGTDALRKLRRTGLACPVIFITAFGVSDAHRDVVALGDCTIMEKPVDLIELTTLVRERLAAAG